MGNVQVSSEKGLELPSQAISDEALVRAATAFLRQRPGLKDALVAKLTAAIDYEDTPAASAEEVKNAPGVTLFYHTNWPAPRLHCRLGPESPWTTPPGLKMGLSKTSEFPLKTSTGAWYTLTFPSATRLEFLCNDGGSNWDKAAGGANYMVTKPGLWTLEKSCLLEYGQPKPEVVAAAVAAQAVPAGLKAVPPPAGSPLEIAKGGGIVLVYHTPWPRPHLHFRENEACPWTQAPGQLLSVSGLAGFPDRDPNGGWFALYFPTAAKLEFLPNDGGAQWDKPRGGANYHLPHPGAWKLCAGKVEPIRETFEPAPRSSLDAKASSPVVTTSFDPTKPPATAKVVAPALTMADTKEVAKTLAEQMKADGITLLYRSNWATPHVHCRASFDGTWSAVPGLKLSKASTDIAATLGVGPTGDLFAVNFPKLQTIECLFNDGGPHYRWDKAAGGDNFIISGPGVWMLSGGRAEKFLPPPEAPGCPEIMAVTRTSVTLSWPSNAGGVKGYRVYRDGKLVTAVSGGVTKHTETGLLAAHFFRYTVSAVSTQGLEGPLSGEATAETEPAGKPGAPEDLKVVSASGKGVVLSWNVPSDTGGAPVTAYEVFRDSKLLGTVLATLGKAAVKFEDKNVKQGGNYSYTIKACHLPQKPAERKKVLAEREAATAPEEHDLLTSIPDDVNVGPAAGPIEVDAVDELEMSKCDMDLRKQLTSRGITVYYKSRWGKTYMHCMARPEVGWTDVPGLQMMPSSTHAFPAAEGWFTAYYPYARSIEFVVNDGAQQWDKAPGGTNYKVTIPGVVLLANGHIDRVAAPPAAATKPTAEAVDGSRVRLAWKALPAGEGEAPVAGYKVYRNGRMVHQTQDATTLTFTDLNLFAFTDYEYAIAAVNSQGVTGPLSDTVPCKTELPGPPSEPVNLRTKVEKMDRGIAVRVEWEPPKDCGGAPVASYEVLRDGLVVHVYDVPTDRLRSEAEACIPVDPDAGVQRRWVRSTCSYSTLSWFCDALEWLDDDVVSGGNYSYQVRAVQLGPERADELKEGGLVQRCGSRFLDSVQPSVVGAPCDPVVCKATPFLDAPRMGERKPMIMFQAFDWSSCKAKSWYTVLLGLLPELRSAGVNCMWLPPPSDSVDEHAYLPRKWYVLDNKYGSAEALQTLVTALHEQEIYPMLDVVVNHRCASLQDSMGRWLKFEEPDWEGWAVCHDSPAVPGGSGNGVTGEPAQYAPSVDHKNPKVQDDVRAFIKHMMDDIGFRALRFDFVKGYAPHFQKEYVKAAGCPYAVAENWNGDANGLHEYVRQCEGVMAVYDFPLYYVLKRCVATNNFSELNNNGQLNGIAGRDPARAVTFTDNHDTYQLAIVGGAFGNNEQVLRGYAFILTHPGVPCVFHHDYVRGDHVKAKILELCSIRTAAGIHAMSSVSIQRSEGGCYAAIVDGKVALKLGTNDWSPGGGWKKATAGHEFCVWVRA